MFDPLFSNKSIHPHTSYRQSLTDALTDNILGALSMTDQPQNGLNKAPPRRFQTCRYPFNFGVQRLDAEQANVPVERLQVNFASSPRSEISPLQPGC
jgi:hypothetical protein